MAISSTTLLLSIGVILLLARPAHAFGAGNIASVSSIEGSNWRHGDIEDTLLTILMSRAAGGKKFDKMSIARVYFGNWLRDYSQAIDVGTVKYVSAEAIRILLWVLGFMTFGYGTKEFEVTSERLGCYRPEDHIDNPKDYADNLDAREYDRRLRGPVNERVELGIDQQRGMKNYIASEGLGIMTSAEHVRKLFHESIRLGRSFARSGNQNELYEALRLLGTGCHCLEDFSAHSNYTELALIELGERDIFPHVGRRTQMRLPGARSEVYPLITGTFGGVDFLHSVMGEFNDKATQSEIQELEGTMVNGSNANTSMLKNILDKLPEGLLGGGDQKGKADELQQNATTAQMQNMHVTPKEPEAWTIQMQEIQKQIYPIMEWHDDLMKNISKTIESIPVLPELIEQFEEQVNIFVFSLLAPYILPIISQLKVELNTGSSEIIQSSQDKQLIVFDDDSCSDPTHSMLSKDHFSNILNEPAGKIASAVLKWVVPQLMQAYDDESIDADRTITRIINGIFHHPAQRGMGDDGASDGRRQMFAVVEQWWGEMQNNEKNEFRQKLSRNGVKSGQNHVEGQHDTGHGCGKPLGMAKASVGDGASGGIISELLSGLQGGSAASQAGSGYGRPTQGNAQIAQFASEAAGGGALGGLVGALAGGVGGGLLGGIFGGGNDSSNTTSYTQSSGNTQSYTEVGKATNQYGRQQTGQASYQETQLPGGGQRTEYKKYEQGGQGAGGYGYEEKTETKPSYGGGYEEKKERKYKSGGQTYESEEKKYKSRKSDDEDSGNEYKKKNKKKNYGEEDSGDEYKKKKKNYGDEDSGDEYKKKKKNYGEEDSGDEYKKKEKKHKKKGYGEQDSDDDKPKRPTYGEQDYDDKPKRPNYGDQAQSYGRQEPPMPGGFGEERGYGGPPPRQEFGGGGGYGGPPPRQEYGGGGGYGGPPQPQEFGGGGGGYGGGFGGPPREEFGGGGGGGGYGGGNEYGGGGGGYGGGGEGYGGGGRGGYEGRNRGEEEPQEEYREEQQDDGNRRGWGGGGY